MRKVASRNLVEVQSRHSHGKRAAPGLKSADLHIVDPKFAELPIELRGLGPGLNSLSIR